MRWWAEGAGSRLFPPLQACRWSQARMEFLSFWMEVRVAVGRGGGGAIGAESLLEGREGCSAALLSPLPSPSHPLTHTPPPPQGDAHSRRRRRALPHILAPAVVAAATAAPAAAAATGLAPGLGVDAGLVEAEVMLVAGQGGHAHGQTGASCQGGAGRWTEGGALLQPLEAAVPPPPPAAPNRCARLQRMALWVSQSTVGSTCRGGGTQTEVEQFVKGGRAGVARRVWQLKARGARACARCPPSPPQPLLP